MDAPEALVAITPFNFKRIAAMFPPLSSASAEVFRFAPALAVTVDDDWVPVLTARLPSALRWSKIGVPSALALGAVGGALAAAASRRQEHD